MPSTKPFLNDPQRLDSNSAAHRSAFPCSSATSPCIIKPYCLQLSEGVKVTLMVTGGTTLGQEEAAKAEAKREEAAKQRRLQKEQKNEKLNARQQRSQELARAGTLKVSSCNMVASSIRRVFTV